MGQDGIASKAAALNIKAKKLLGMRARSAGAKPSSISIRCCCLRTKSTQEQ